MSERVICHLCATAWTVPNGSGARAYHEHYTETHFDLEAERVSR